LPRRFRRSPPARGTIETVKLLRYIELKSGYSDNGPAWIGYVTPSKTGRTIYFNGRAESFWISGVKKNGHDRHRAGAGIVLIEAAAVPEYLKTIGASALNKSRYVITHSIVPTDPEKFERQANMSLYENITATPERPNYRSS
jgi:hypothetical protein